MGLRNRNAGPQNTSLLYCMESFFGFVSYLYLSSLLAFGDFLLVKRHRILVSESCCFCPTAPLSTRLQKSAIWMLQVAKLVTVMLKLTVSY